MHAGVVERDAGRVQVLPLLEEERVLRRLRVVEGPTGLGDPDAGEVIAVVDVETTGFDPDEDAVIELAVRRIRHDADGVVTRIGRLWSWREDPGRPIPQEVSRLTSLSDDDVRGRSIDTVLATSLLADARWILAHNANFDLRFVERRLPELGAPGWACSMSEVDWPAHGFDGRKLGHLLSQCGWFHDAHSAGSDVDAVIALMRHGMPDGRPALAHLLENANDDVWRVRAVGARISLKGLLKRRGYRWDPDGRVWHRTIAERDREREREWLAERIYHPGVNPFAAEPEWDRMAWGRRHA
ncbi:DNA polymerase-3 subunit epsilon [Sphingomonas jinjuensis]|uniref:DNA polymerase-3 subunit epsilon n=1 Tax=Sphingomonas jinjuensis TaxID=535907 RepID=A0A840FMB4_9SPHN|nr:3'-5' exonuclease [Sphingomonas jinjuensis]MBB4155068.1 DNA polymerase-3 subunit epsilon [Sphingomonas jinjuensis]